MNCQKVEELLPLYVSRDLEEKLGRLVTSHLQACKQCARSAQEFGEASQLLQLFGPPEFSEATYAAVRSRVLREIERETSQPQSTFALDFVRRLFQPRIMWAVSTAVLLAVCLFAYYFVAYRTNGPQLQAKAGSQPDKLIDTPGENHKPGPTGTAGVPPAAATILSRPRLNQVVWHSRRAGGSSTPAGLPGRGPRPPAVPVKTDKYFQVEPNGASPDNSLTSDKTLRLEIQTSNPNIRIIWFSQPANNQGSSNESSKGI